mgnify:CR=1 FL=1
MMLLLAGATGAAVGQQTVYVVGEPDLNVYAPTNTVSPGEETELTFQIDNEGNLRAGQDTNRELVTTARNVVVNAKATEDTPITVKTNRKSVGSITETSPKEVPLQLEIPDDAKPGKYTVKVDIDYRYSGQVGVNRRGGGPGATQEQTGSTTEQITVEITDDARFEVTEIDSSLRVGEEGRITGQLENIGRQDATNAEVSFAPESETVVALESNVAVGDIPAGESTEFSIPVEVTSNAEAVPKRFDLPVTFRDENGIRQSDDDPEFRVDVANRRDAFLIDVADSSIEAGATDTLDIEVTNNLDERVTDIEGKLFADDPLSSSNDETYTEALDPGETTTVTVDLSAAGDATIKTYPVSMDFRYTDSDGDSKLSDSYRTAISVTEPADDGGGLPILPLLLGLLVVAGIGAFLWRRNGGSVDDLGGLRDE